MNVDVTARGEITEAAVVAARERIGRLERFAHAPILGASVVLIEESNPKLARPSRAEGEINVNGHILRSHVAAAGMPQAIDRLAAQLQRQIGSFVERRERLSRRPRERPKAGEWRHSDRPIARPSFVWRVPSERAIVRHKAFAIETIDRVTAVSEMLDLDHDFYLFHDADTDADAVVYRREDGSISIICADGARPAHAEPDAPEREAPRFTQPISLEHAVDEMNVFNHRFLFFTRSESGRSSIIYLRYDGDYGLIEPAD